MKYKTIIFIAFSAFVCSCASKPGSDAVLLEMSKKPHHSINQAAISESNNTLIENAEVESKLDSTDSVLKYEDTFSYYEVYSIENDNKDIQIEIKSICSCFGYDKRIMLLTPILLDENGKELEFEIQEYSLVEAGFIPLHFKMLVNVNADNFTKLKLIILSDNSSLDQLVRTTILTNSYGGAIASLSVRSYPVGKFRLKFTSM